jgi:hypothetical protein
MGNRIGGKLMMDKYAKILELAQHLIADLEHRIALNYEDDDCTSCFVQGLEEALEDFDMVYDALKQAVHEDIMDEIVNSDTRPAPGQMKLL